MGTPRWPHLRPRRGALGPLLLVLFGLVATGIAFWDARRTATRFLDTQFREDAGDRVSLVAGSLQKSLYVVNSVRRFVLAGATIDRARFALFSRPFLADEPAMHALVWVPRVPRAERTDFELKRQLDWSQPFRITERDADGRVVEARDREVYYPVLFIEPLEITQSAVGFDMGSEPPRLSAIEQACDRGVPIASQAVRSIVSGEQSIILFAPVYREGGVPPTIAERRAALTGYALVFFRINTLVQAAVGATLPMGLDFDLFDASETVGQQPVYRWTSRLPDRPTWRSLLATAAPRATIRFEFAGHPFAVDVRANRAYLHRRGAIAHWAVLPLGAALSLLLAGYLWLQVRQREHLENAVVERTRALRRRNQELALVNRVMAATETELESKVLLDVVCRETAEAFGLASAFAVLLDEARAAGTVVAEHRIAGRPSVIGWTLTVPANSEVQGPCQSRQTIVSEDPAHDPALETIRDLVTWLGVSAVLAAPLVVDGQNVGCIVVGAALPRHFPNDLVTVVTTVANQVAGALARAWLSETRRRLMTAIEQTPESVVITDPGGRIQYVNPTFERVSGYSRQEAIGETLRILKSGRQDAAFYQDLWSRIAAGEVFRTRFINRRKDGKLFVEDAVIAPVRDEQGAIVNYIAVKRDITREQALEEQVRQAQKLDAIGRLAGGVAHDFNNLLMAIGGHADQALTRLPDDHQARQNLDEILESVRRASGLTRQLLAFARRQPIEPEVLQLNELIASLSNMLHRLIGEDIELVVQPAADLGVIKADPGQIEQVLLNLVLNSRDAMPRGGQITIRTANVMADELPALRLGDGPLADSVAVSVSDTGEGMTDEVKAHLFEPFFTTKEPGKGTGLGLATCFGIVHQNGGQIRSESEPGRGSTFTAYFPRVGDDGTSGRKAALIEDPPRGSETVLLAEDESSVRALVGRMLRTSGYRVFEAASGSEALVLAAERGADIHLLVTDVVMPGMNGLELAETLRQALPGVKVLFMSGHTGSVVVEEVLKQPGVRFLPKPFTSAVLARKVREILDKGREGGSM